MELRRLFKADAEQVFSLRLRALESVPTAFGASLETTKLRGVIFFEEILSAPGNDNVIFGAISNNTIVGMVGIRGSNSPKERHKANIWGMFVDSNHRNKGVGAALLDLAIQHAKENMKASAVHLSVESSNSAARKLYETRNFKCWGTEPRALYVNGRYFNEDHMVADL